MAVDNERQVHEYDLVVVRVEERDGCTCDKVNMRAVTWLLQS